MDSTVDIGSLKKVWFCDHFIPSHVRVEKYPRLLHWININVGDKFIKRAMERGVMLDDYGASSKEISELIMKASVNTMGEDLKDENKARRKSKHREAVMAALDDQDTLIEELEKELIELEAELVEEKNKDDGGYFMLCATEDFHNDYATEGGLCRTPYTGYSPKLY
ncbi:hypothetical protein LR48_Vigan205s002800 [Vigna angularis]|uniref:Uncharacterized protein n=1 Tax=Phaseolus angularis TaxID=3914 RepID=A0A0L9T6C3_PHAAN|nr:hypothetical protein LR48_Vigan205s002800 [Vigna angularis]